MPPGEPDIAAEEVDRVATIEAGTVGAAFQSVDETFRAPLTLFDLEDLSDLEIAEALEVPIGPVMSRLSRGKTPLRAALQREEAEGKKSRGVQRRGAEETGMSNNGAKFILSAYRPGGRDARIRRWPRRRRRAIRRWAHGSRGNRRTMRRWRGRCGRWCRRQGGAGRL